MNSNLTFSHYTFLFGIQESGNLPAFKGSMWHGVIGSRVRSLFCVFPGSECKNCSWRKECGYVRVFEPDVALEEGQKVSIPRGFILRDLTDLRREYQKGDILSFSMTLVGDLQDYISLFVSTFYDDLRLGKERISVKLLEVRQRNFSKGTDLKMYPTGETIRPSTTKGTPALFFSRYSHEQADSLSLELLTPTRFKTDGKLNRSPSFDQIAAALLRKLNQLEEHYGSGSPLFDYETYQTFMDIAKNRVRVIGDVEWVDWKRYSRRSESTITLGGFKGRILAEGDVSQLLPLFLLGEYFNIGKQATFGLGQFECDFA